jgi:type II secretory pathway component PulF
MPAYRFKATGRDGSSKQGIIQATSQADAEDRVRGRGFTIIQVVEAKLKRPREVAAAPPQTKRNLVLTLLLFLILAGAVFVYLDPWNVIPDLVVK